MEDYLEVLRREFAFKEGSFGYHLRRNFKWDKDAFSRLVTAMQICCEKSRDAEMLERWLAGGFWYLSWFVPNWTSHANFPRPEPEEYYQKAYKLLLRLAYGFFEGENNLTDSDIDFT